MPRCYVLIHPKTQRADDPDSDQRAVRIAGWAGHIAGEVATLQRRLGCTKITAMNLPCVKADEILKQERI